MKRLDIPPVTIKGAGQSLNNYDKNLDESCEMQVLVCGSVKRLCRAADLQDGEAWP